MRNKIQIKILICRALFKNESKAERNAIMALLRDDGDVPRISDKDKINYTRWACQRR